MADEKGHSGDDGPSAVQTHLDLGIAYAEMSLLPDAVAELETVLRLDPENGRARAELLAAKARLAHEPGLGKPVGNS